MGITGIPAIPVILKSLHPDFPAKSLQFPANICSVGSTSLLKYLTDNHNFAKTVIRSALCNYRYGGQRQDVKRLRSTLIAKH